MELSKLEEGSEYVLQRLREAGSTEDLVLARKLSLDLCHARQFALLASVTEALSRRCPDDAQARRLHAQALIEQGYATAAIELLRPLATRLPATDPEQAEVTGLLGRAFKQIFLDANDKTGPMASDALAQAVAYYRRSIEANAADTWHGVNLLALLVKARRLGLDPAPDVTIDVLARKLISRLNKLPEAVRNVWHLAALAEASLGLDDWAAVEGALHRYVADPGVRAFHIASTLKQFTEVWDIEAVDDHGRALANILRARLLSLSTGEVLLSARDLAAARSTQPDAGQLEAVLGELGTQTYRWYMTGLKRAAGVCAIRHSLGARIGTGWLAQARDLGLEREELVVVTNAHVVSGSGAQQSIQPESAEVVFEANAPGQSMGVREILYSSPPDRHDYSILRLSEQPAAIEPLPVARGLPLVEPSTRVLVIGHPGGRELEFSMQDNELLDHDGPTAGKPRSDGVWRVHYRAPTEKGSSGSPVFNGSLWQVIALHRAGGKRGMSRLNGKAGMYEANEGIAIQSIRADVERQRGE